MAQFPEVGVKLVADGAGKYIADLGRASDATDGLGRSANGASGMMRSFAGQLSSVGALLTGGIVAGAGALGVAFGAAAVTGLSFNNSMEQVEAQLSAFLPSAEEVESTIAMINERAAATPFAFEDMARAAAGLIPAANQAGVSLEELLEIAEVLAASNPSEGLDGAAFALREAVSGDFTSIIERFNLPRSYINQLKEEGVPALEAVTRTMAELGLSTALVTNLAETAQGRWSTIMDTFTMIAGRLTEPIFDVISDSMGRFLDVLNEAEPIIDEMVTNVTGRLDLFIGALENGFAPLDAFTIAITGLAPPEVMDALAYLSDTVIPTLGQMFETYVQPIIDFVLEFVKMQDVMIALSIAIGAFVLPIIGSLLAAMFSIIAPVIAVIAVVALLRTAWEENWGGIQEKTAAVVTWLQTYVPLAWQTIQEKGAELGAWLTTSFTAFWGTMQAIVEPVIAALTAFWQKYGEDIMLTWHMFSTNVTNGTIAWFTTLGAIFDYWLSLIGAFVATATTVWQSTWDAHMQWLPAALDIMWQGVTMIWEGAMTAISGMFTAFLAFLRGDWDAWGEGMGQAASGIMEMINGAFVVGIGILQSIVMGGITAVSQAFANHPWFTIGADIVGGIINGLTANLGRLSQAAVDMATTAYNAAASALGIQSPSKVFMQIGMDTGMGMALGIEAMQGTVAGASEGLANAAFSPVASPAQISNTVNNRNTVVNFTGNYSSSPEITDGATLTRVMAGYA